MRGSLGDLVVCLDYIPSRAGAGTTSHRASGVIEVRIRELSQLFNSLDPSPFFEKDIDPKAEEYIVDSFRELNPGTSAELVVHLDQPPRPEEEKAVGDSIREHFARQALRLQRQLRQLLRRGFVSLGIGLGFLAIVLGVSEGIAEMVGESPLALLFQQSLLIVGWVAMWRPLEIFLYDWWPIVGEKRVHARLSGIQVRIAASLSRR